MKALLVVANLLGRLCALVLGIIVVIVNLTGTFAGDKESMAFVAIGLILIIVTNISNDVESLTNKESI